MMALRMPMFFEGSAMKRNSSLGADEGLRQQAEGNKKQDGYRNLCC